MSSWRFKVHGVQAATGRQAAADTEIGVACEVICISLISRLIVCYPTSKFVTEGPIILKFERCRISLRDDLR